MTATATPSKTDEPLARLTDGVERLTSSDEWLRYLYVQRNFHRYPFGNCILIALQSPDATRVAGFRRWLELGRCVRKGERGIAILAPIVSRLKVEDAVTGEERTVIGAPVLPGRARLRHRADRRRPSCPTCRVTGLTATAPPTTSCSASRPRWGSPSRFATCPAR